MKSYVNVPNKRLIQGFSLTGCDSIITLGGPDILNCIDYLKSLGFKNIVSFESNKSIYDYQVSQKPDCQLINTNVLDHLNYNCFYDLDFCCSVRTIEPWLHRIVNLRRYSITLSIRPVGLEKTIKTFFKYGNAHLTKYRDSVPMLTFYNN